MCSMKSQCYLVIICALIALGCSDSRSEEFDIALASYIEETTSAHSGSFLVLSPFACSNCKSKIFSFLSSQSIESGYSLGVVLVGGNRQDSIHVSRQLAGWKVFLDRKRHYYHEGNQIINKENIVFLTLKASKVESYVPVNPVSLTQDFGKIMNALQMFFSSDSVDK